MLQHIFTDATLACDGQFYPVHKFVLATCSEFFSAMFEWTPCVNPVLVLNNIQTRDLEAILDFMYTGQASVKEVHLGQVMKAAQSLRVRGLALLEETKPVMHKPQPPVSSIPCPSAPSNANYIRPSPSGHHEIKENSSSMSEPAVKRLKSEYEEDTKHHIVSPSRPDMTAKPPVSLPSISSLTSLNDSSLSKSPQRTGGVYRYEAASPQSLGRTNPQLTRAISSPHPYASHGTPAHPPSPAGTSTRHLQQLLSATKGTPPPQPPYRHVQTPHLSPQHNLKRKEALLHKHQQLEHERRLLHQQLLHQSKIPPGSVQHQHPQKPAQHQHHIQQQQQFSSHYQQPSQLQQHRQQPQQVHHHQIQAPVRAAPMQQHQMLQLQQQYQQQQASEQQNRPVSMVREETTKQSEDKNKVTGLLLDQPTDVLTAEAQKSSNSSTPTGNNNNLSTGNHNFPNTGESYSYLCFKVFMH